MFIKPKIDMLKKKKRKEVTSLQRGGEDRNCRFFEKQRKEEAIQEHTLQVKTKEKGRVPE